MGVSPSQQLSRTESQWETPLPRKRRRKDAGSVLDLISPEKLFNHDSVILVTSRADGAASGSSRVKDTDDKSHALADVAEALTGVGDKNHALADAAEALTGAGAKNHALADDAEALNRAGDKNHALANAAEALNGRPSGHGSVRACMVDDGADTQEQQRFTQDIAKLMKHVFTLVRAEHKHRFHERQRSIPSMNRNRDICYVVRLCA